MTIRNVPDIYKRTYSKAMSGKSRKCGVKMMCLECCGYLRNEVALCSDNDCPLYQYRPFCKVKKDEEVVSLFETPT